MYLNYLAHGCDAISHNVLCAPEPCHRNHPPTDRTDNEGKLTTFFYMHGMERGKVIQCRTYLIYTIPYILSPRFVGLFRFTLCGYEVSGIVLLLDLKGAVRLGRNKDMSVHVLTCTSYDFKALMPVMWKLRR
jgi:hypothetical protein